MAQPPANVKIRIVQGMAEPLPDSYSGDTNEVDIEEFFTKYKAMVTGTP